MHGCPAKRVVDPPMYIEQNFYHPQPVEVVHPIEIVNRHHCVPVPYHVYTYQMKNIWCDE